MNANPIPHRNEARLKWERVKREIESAKQKRARLDEAIRIREEAAARLESEAILNGDSDLARNRSICPA